MFKRNSFIFLLFILISNIGYSQGWAKKAGGTSSDYGYGIATDGSGNSLVTGRFAGTATFGAGEPNETALVSSGWNDIFVAKYDPNDALLWAKKAGGDEWDIGYGIATDGSGNSFVTGYFSTDATFGAGGSNETALVSAGNFDIFVAKYDPNGVLLWAKKAGGTSYDYGFGIATDGSGNSLVTGRFEGTATFGAGESNETALGSSGWEDVFVAKYDPNGALLWAKKAGGTSSDYGEGIATDGSGNSLVTGVFEGTATFGAGESNETALVTSGNEEIFVAKYNTDGTLAWAKKAGGIQGDSGKGIATDDSNNSLVTGSFAGTATFGWGEPNQTALVSAGGDEIFIAKYDPNGALLWAKKAGGTSDDYGYGIATDGSGNSLVTGYFQGTADFAGTALVSSGGDDIFIAKYNQDGALPVELSSFAVESTPQGVLCSWTTESEIENLGFIIERKTDGTDWIEIVSYKTDDSLLGQGTTSSYTDYEYLDVFVEPNTKYEYRLADIDYNGVVTYHAIRKVTVVHAPLTSIVEEFTVLPAYPNPFNPSTTIRYGLAAEGTGRDLSVQIQIYDITGKLINTLFNGEQTPGWHSVIWNGTNQFGEQSPAGLYFSKITSGNEVKTSKLMLLR